MGEQDAPKLMELRRDLHRLAELSDFEQRTAQKIRQYLSEYDPDEIIEGIGGHGLAAVYNGKEVGKTILVRADLDALPIDESISIEHGSETPGVAHKCGHDGHMAIVAGLAPILNEQPPLKGRVVLLFQPAEETGQGAERVLADPKFAAIEPDYVFALHNLPGFPTGSVILREGVFASSSRGMIVELLGRTSHAGEPGQGNSPALAMAHLVNVFSSAPQYFTDLSEATQITVIHARLGHRAFGTSPGEAVVMATLRDYDDNVVERLADSCASLARETGRDHGLETRVSWTEVFPATTNTPQTAGFVKEAALDLGLEIIEPQQPFPWSEDFGHFTAKYPGTLFGLGAGKDHPALHNPDYDFPDSLLNIGVDVLNRVLKLTQKG